MTLYPPQYSGLWSLIFPASASSAIVVTSFTYSQIEPYQRGLVERDCCALSGGYGTCLTFDGSLQEVVIALLGVDFGHRSSDSHLSVRCRPVEVQSNLVEVGDLSCLLTLVVGEEDEPSLADFLQEDVAGVGETVESDGGDAHHVGFDSLLDFSGLLEPLAELHERIFLHLLHETQDMYIWVESVDSVFFADVLDVNAHVGEGTA